MDNVVLPAGLQSLTFGFWYKQSMENFSLPAGLQCFPIGSERIDFTATQIANTAADTAVRAAAGAVSTAAFPLLLMRRQVLLT